MLLSTTFILLGMSLGSMAEPYCPSWFSDLGQRWLDAAPDSPGIQMTLNSGLLNIDCLQSWNSPFENYTANPPLLTDSPYRLASVTKPFASLAVLKLAEEGLVDVNTSITKYLPDWAVESLGAQMRSAEDAKKITPWMMMHHTAGLPNAAADIRFMVMYAENPDLDLSHKEWLDWAVDNMEPVGPPGGDWIYSDTAYGYLGALIEHVSGLSLGAAVRKAGRFDDLGMDSTYWETEEPPEGVPDRAGQYLSFYDITNVHPSHGMWGGSGLISNSEDLAVFARAFHHGFHLSKKWLKVAYELVPTPDDVPSVGYGCGWHLEFISGQKAWHHRGGWGTWMYYFPDLDLSLTGAINQSDRRPTMPLIIEDVVNHVLEEIQRLES